MNLLPQLEDSNWVFKFAMQLAIILNQDKTGVKWGEAVRREEVDRSDVLDCLDSIHETIFCFHKVCFRNTYLYKFYEKTLPVLEKPTNFLPDPRTLCSSSKNLM